MPGYEGAEQELCNLWVRQQIASVAADLDAIATGLSSRVFLDYAPKGTTWPVVIFQCQDEPRDVRGVGLATVMVDTLYLVKAVAQLEEYGPLAPIAKVLHTAMTTATGSQVDGGTVLTSVRERQFAMPEVSEGVQVRHLGGLYRIQAQG